MEDIEVPSLFLCPISLQIMKDPVTVSTGITYDRENIEKWLFSGKNDTCPITKQLVSDTDLTPNHTVRRLIQGWCTLNASHGIERIPTPKPPVNKPRIIKLLNDTKSPHLQMKSLQILKSIALESDTNKRCMEAAGAVEVLASIVCSMASLEEDASTNDEFEFTRASDEAINILYHLQISGKSLKNLVNGNNGEFIQSLTRVLQCGSYESRAYAMLLLKSMFEVADPIALVSLKPDFFTEIVQLLYDQITSQASKATLQVLIQVCPWGRNIVKAVQAGVVKVLIDLLLETSERRSCEMMLTVLDRLCGCAEGRAELLKHGAGLAVVSKKILRVSHMASERAIRILSFISKFSATPGVIQDMLQLGIVAKLCLVLQVDCGNKSKDKAREILKSHARAWKGSSCIPLNLLSSYP